MGEYENVKQRTIQAVIQNTKDPGEKIEEVAGRIADEVMNAIADNYRSITEVHRIVEAVRAGARVQIEYEDPDEEDFMDPYVLKACW